MNNEDISLQTITPNPPADFTPSLAPYRPLRPFRYWCQKVLPLVYDDSLSYYELLCKVVDFLNKTMEDVETLHVDVTNLYNAYIQLQQYVNDYFKNLNVQEEINKKLDDMIKDGSLSDILESLMIKHPVSSSKLIGQNFSDDALQGGCYIGNNRYVYYTAIANSNSGILHCINLNNGSILWEHNLELYHGNSITFNSNTNELYICYCYNNNDPSILIPTIGVISLNDTTKISREFDLPVEGCYSFTYDETSNKYYAICYRGREDGKANKLYIFDNNFKLVDSVILKNYPSLDGVSSTQGVQVVRNCVAYVLSYYPTPTIYANNIYTGDLLFVYNIGRFINNFRYTGEVEFLSYNKDSDDFIVGCYANKNILGCDKNIISFGCLGIYKNVSPHIPSSMTSESPINKPVTLSMTFKHEVILKNNIISCFKDAMEISSFYNLAINVDITSSNLVNIVLNHTNGDVRYLFSDSTKFNVEGTVIGGCATIRNCNITGSGIAVSGCGNCSVYNCTASNCNYVISGGQNGTLIIDSVTISDNSKLYYGLHSNATVLNSTPRFNEDGLNSGSLRIINTIMEITNNYNDYTCTLKNCNLSRNHTLLFYVNSHECKIHGGSTISGVTSFKQFDYDDARNLIILIEGTVNWLTGVITVTKFGTINNNEFTDERNTIERFGAIICD